MNSHTPKCNSRILKSRPVYGKHSLLLLFLLFPLVRTSKASSSEYWIKDRTSAGSTGFTAFPGSLKAARGASWSQCIRAVHSSSCQPR